MPDPAMRLDHYAPRGFDRGASRLKDALWLVVQGAAFASWLPGSRWRVALLRAFGAEVGRGVVIKPGARVKFPWRLRLGDHVWLGEGAWIDNLDTVTVGNHSCVSQGAYLCTGSHDWSDPAFGLITKPITIGTGCWIAAFARLGPGVTIHDGGIVALGAVAVCDVAAHTILSADGTTRTRPKPKPKAAHGEG